MAYSIPRESRWYCKQCCSPALNPARKLITSVICGVRVEDIADPTTQEIRYIDKLIDELAKGKLKDKILRK